VRRQPGPGMPAFDFAYRPRIIFGVGSSARAGELAAAHQATRVLLVTDAGVAEAGHADAVAAALRDHGMAVQLFTGVHANPALRDVSACAAVARRHDPDLILGLGGGSALDVAKGTAMVCAEGIPIAGRPGMTVSDRPHLPVIAMPTTAGTGSECQPHAVIADDETHVKVAFATSRSLPGMAVLDPALTLTQPRAVTADSGFDAIVHAVEVWVTRPRTQLSSLFAGEAFSLLTGNLPTVLADPGDLDARGGMQLGAAWAGLGIAHSMLGAAHAAGNPLTARYGISHGAAVASMLPAVIGFNSRDDRVRARYAALAARAGLTAGEHDPAERDRGLVAALLARLRALWSLTGHPAGLAGFGVRAGDIGGLAAEAAEQRTGTFNPRPVNASVFRELYTEALAGVGQG
jgi:alcohol dehydrogenase class IV